MLASAHYIATTSDEESHAAAYTEAVPRQVRFARRSAALALLVSSATFAAVATTAARSLLAHPAAAAAPPSPAVAGGGAPVVGLAGVAAPAARSGVALHRTKAPSAVYLERSEMAEKVQDLPAGSTLLPMKKGPGGWVQAVVPAQNGAKATMGWVHVPAGLDAVAETPRELARPLANRAITKAELSQKWATLRSQNAQNKAHLRELEAGVKRHYAENIVGAGSSMVTKEAKTLHVDNLRQGVEKLGQEVQKQLDVSPKKVIGSIAAALK